MIGAALDANVLASGFAGSQQPTSTPGEIIRRWQQGSFRLVVSDHLLEEMARTLTKPYFRRRLTVAEADAAVQLLRDKAEPTSITIAVIGIASHPEDDLVLATAVSGNVDYLVTGDLKLQALGRFRDVAIVSPRSFLDRLERADSSSS